MGLSLIHILVRERDSKNPKLPTGDIEVVPSQIEVLGRCRYNELPFPINRSREADEAARLKYRYLDLRNPEAVSYTHLDVYKRQVFHHTGLLYVEEIKKEWIEWIIKPNIRKSGPPLPKPSRSSSPATGWTMVGAPITPWPWTGRWRPERTS